MGPRDVVQCIPYRGTLLAQFIVIVLFFDDLLAIEACSLQPDWLRLLDVFHTCGFTVSRVHGRTQYFTATHVEASAYNWHCLLIIRISRALANWMI